jgi:hypothetical protein
LQADIDIGAGAAEEYGDYEDELFPARSGSDAGGAARDAGAAFGTDSLYRCYGAGGNSLYT